MDGDQIEPFRSHEMKLIFLLNSAMSQFKYDSSAQVTKLAQNLLEFYNIPGMVIQKVIRLCKSFAGFSMLKQEDQLVLLKSFFPAMSSIWYAFQYQLQRDGFPMIYVRISNISIF